MNENLEKLTLTAKEAAQLFGVSYWLITQLVKQNKIPHFRMGGKILFRKESLLKYMQDEERATLS